MRNTGPASSHALAVVPAPAASVHVAKTAARLASLNTPVLAVPPAVDAGAAPNSDEVAKAVCLSNVEVKLRVRRLVRVEPACYELQVRSYTL